MTPRSCLEQILDFRIEIPGNRERYVATVGRDETLHRVVGQMHAIGALVDEDCYRCVRCRVGNGPGHLLHDEWIADDEAQAPWPLSALFLAQDLADVIACELHQLRGSDRRLNTLP